MTLHWVPKVQRLPVYQENPDGSYRPTSRWYACAEAEEGRRMYVGWNGYRSTRPMGGWVTRFFAARAARRFARELNAEYSGTDTPTEDA